ncbi:MAG: S-methyl-5-thioribose-1-phosphate isomerase [Oscillospiraceae bacterium]|nr:S-methyl-5-thioribose-1-phosphate isomerase [Oscillospiraceae bacterium]
MELEKVTHAENIRLAPGGDAVIIIDQSLLPNETRFLSLREAGEMWEAIHSLRVRGAPAIGIFAAWSLYVLSRDIDEKDFEGFYASLREKADYLNSSRPTAVNLSAMLRRMTDTALENRDAPLSELPDILHREAEAIHNEDMEMCRRISEFGLSLIKNGDGLLTHCNAGPLATSRYGTGQGPFYLAKERGMDIHVYCDETRPLLQGVRLTAWELSRAGVPCTLICDNMAATVMGQGKIQACFVGCDRVAMNGDAANKIGTRGVAILAKYHGIPFYVLGPTTTIDRNCPTGADIHIELRDPEEIKEKFYASPMAPEDVECYNPSFDVTESELITAIITEKGICYPPYEKSLAALFE